LSASRITTGFSDLRMRDKIARIEMDVMALAMRGR
jgi:hypothetical protein